MTSHNSRVFFAFSESDLACIPPCRVLLEILHSHRFVDQIKVVRACTPDVVCTLNDIASLEVVITPRQQPGGSITQKIAKWLRLTYHVAVATASHRSDKTVFYTTSIRAFAFALILRATLRSRGRMCYHQFELIDWSSAPLVDHASRWVVNFASSHVHLVLLPFADDTNPALKYSAD